MTLIIATKTKDGIIVGTDGRVMAGDTIVKDDGIKYIETKRYNYYFAGALISMDLLPKLFKDKESKVKEDDELIDIHRALRKYLKEWNDSDTIELFFDCIIIDKKENKIYVPDAASHIIETNEEAIGSGGAFAYGTLKYLKSIGIEIDEGRIDAIIENVSSYCTTVGGTRRIQVFNK